MPEDIYYTLALPSEGFFKDKGSKFFAFAFPIEEEEEVKKHIDTLKKQFYDARHHCYAFQLGSKKEIQRFSDDGEPSGTAGRPIYGQIQGHELTNILIVVIRYFGGTKLGVRGLINAYKFAAEDAINNATIKTCLIKDIYEIQYSYPLMNEVMHIIKDEDLETLDTNFQLDCKLTFAVRKDNSQRIYEKFKAMYPMEINFIKTI